MSVEKEGNRGFTERHGNTEGNCKDNNHYHFPSASLHTSPDGCVL